MNRLIHVGFGNIVNTDKIIAIVSPEAAPIKRLVQKAKETGQAMIWPLWTPRRRNT